MSTRPRRTTANQKDSSNDMLGLSREEERMLQRAMYDSLRQQNKFKFRKFKKSKFHKKSMTTRSMAVGKLTISVPENNVPDSTEFVMSTQGPPLCNDGKIGKEIKRGTRYSPMRKGPLSEMLKSLENKMTQINAISNPVVVKPLGKRCINSLKHKSDVVKDNEACSSTKSPKLIIENIFTKKHSYPKIMKKEAKPPIISASKLKSLLAVSTKPSNSFGRKSNQRTQRSASLAARSYWLSQVSDTSSPNRYQSKISLPSTSLFSDSKKSTPTLKTETKVSKNLIYNRKVISTSQIMSRNILATAAKRVKKAKLKSDIRDNRRRNSSKLKSAKESDAQNHAVIPPELWLDPKGQPVDTQDFINFLLYRDTPYLEPSLKWFHLPPHRRKQRFYKVIQSEPGSKFNETVVYTEKKEGGGKEVVVHCIPPKLVDESSEIVSSTSDQSSTPGENKIVLSASGNSSCNTHAAVDDESPKIVPLESELNGSICKVPEEPTKSKVVQMKISPTYEYRSKHIMQTRNRRA